MHNTYLSLYPTVLLSFLPCHDKWGWWKIWSNMQHQANMILDVCYVCDFAAFSFSFCHQFCIICVEMSRKLLPFFLFFFKLLLSLSVSNTFFLPLLLCWALSHNFCRELRTTNQPVNRWLSYPGQPEAFLAITSMAIWRCSEPQEKQCLSQKLLDYSLLKDFCISTSYLEPLKSVIYIASTSQNLLNVTY